MTPCTRAFRRSALFGAAGFTLLSAACAVATEATALPDLHVRGVPIAAAANRSLTATSADSAAGLPAVRLATQGGAGAQADMHIQGSSFSGAGLALGGLALRHPQTEHFHIESPLPASLFAAPRALTGLDQILRTTAHLVGSVAAEFAPLAPRRMLALDLGERGSEGQSLFWEQPLQPESAWGASVFGGRRRVAGFDYSDNDMDERHAGLRVQHRTPESQVDVAAGKRRKRFGARGFYGAPATFSSLETVNDTLVLGSARRAGATAGEHMRLSVAWREFDDVYVLERTNPGLYENRHRSTVLAGALDGRTVLAAAFGLNWRIEAEQERLASTAFGDFRRERAGLLLAPDWQSGPLTVTAGARTLLFTGDRPAVLALAGAAARLGARQRLFLSFTQNVRQPSYTELYYNSISSVGNPTLERETANAVEAGWSGSRAAGWNWRAAAFHRRTRHTVDWVKTAPAARWEAADLGSIDVTGIELDLGFERPRWGVNSHVGWQNKSDHDAYHAYRYVMDYPRARYGLEFAWRPADWCEVRTSQTLVRFTDSAVRTSSDWGLDGTLAIHVRPAAWRGVALSLAAENLWDNDFEVVAGQRAAGRRVSGSLAWFW